MPNAAQRRQRASEADEDLIRLYLDDIGRHALLTKEDEVLLARRIEAGAAARVELQSPDLKPRRRRDLEAAVGDGEAAARVFVNANLRLVVSIAKRYQASGVALLDLIQEGNLGLMHAVEKFDWRKGFKFSTYSTWWIRQAIQRGIANSARTIRLPIHAGDRLALVAKARERLEVELGRAPTTAEIAAEAGMTESELADVRRFAVDTRSLSDTLHDDSDTELGELLADPRAVEPSVEVTEKVMVGEFDRVLAMLPPDEREVLRLRFGMDRGAPLRPEEVAEHLGLTRANVRRLEERALAKLRHPSFGDDLHDLLAAG